MKMIHACMGDRNAYTVFRAYMLILFGHVEPTNTIKVASLPPAGIACMHSIWLIVSRLLIKVHARDKLPV